jgi:transposase
MLAHIDFLEQQNQLIDDEISTRVVDYEPVLELVQTIPGVGRKVAITLIAEIGTDMSVFPSAAHLASWAGICPGNNASGGKTHSGRARHGPVALRTALTEAAQAAARTKGTCLAAHFHSVRSRRGTFKALGATRHDILTAYWHIVHDGTGYAEPGADWLVRRQGPEHQLARLIRQIERLGAEVTITRTAA